MIWKNIGLFFIHCLAILVAIMLAVPYVFLLLSPFFAGRP